MKKTVCILAILLVSIKFSALWAYDFSADCNGQILYFNIISESEPYMVEIVPQDQFFYTYDTLPKGHLIIPHSVSYNGISYRVTSISKYAFWKCVDLLTVELPKSLTHIGTCAFSRCSSLETIYIPEGVKYFGSRPFSECEKLKSISIDSKNIYFKLYNGIVYDYTMDTLIICPPGLIGNVSIYNQTKIIKSFAFEYCNKITSVDFGNSIEIIEAYAFYCCSGLKGTLIIPNSVRIIGNESFLNCSNIDSLYLGNSLKYIESNAFSFCQKIQTIIIPNSVLIIGDMAFKECLSLKKVIIGDSVIIIGNGCFSNCISLIEVTIGKSVQQLGEAGMNEFGGVFEYCTNLLKINIPGSVKVIGYSAFAACKKLTSITLSDSVEIIGMKAFDGCINLESIFLGASIKKIDRRAFYRCLNLKKIIIKAILPPVLNNSFEMVSDTTQVIVSCDSKQLYEEDIEWCFFKNINEYSLDFSLDVKPNVSSRGYVNVLYPNCITLEAVITAIPIERYSFIKWSDGNSDNPRTVIVTSDTSFTAIFQYSLDVDNNEWPNNTLAIYPNPAHNQITINSGQEIMKELYMYDMVGKEVKYSLVHSTQINLDISDLQNSIYIIKVISENGYIIKKIIKN